MYLRPYTAVLATGKKIRVVDINAPVGKDDAHKAVSDRFPKENLVALIPGVHADHSFTYCPGSELTERFLDPFDTSHLVDSA